MPSHQTILFLITTLLLSALTYSSSTTTTISKKEIEQLEKHAFSQQPGHPSTIQLWEKLLNLDAKNSNARIQLGLHGMMLPNKSLQNNAFLLLQEAFDKDIVLDPIPMPSYQGMILASVIGRYRWEQTEYTTAQKFLNIANDNMYLKKKEEDLCVTLQLATMIDAYPKSIQEKQLSIDKFQNRLEKFLFKHKDTKHVVLDEHTLRESIPGAAADPYVHCICSLFNLELYYVDNIAHLASIYYQSIIKIWPKLSSDYFDLQKNNLLPPRKQRKQQHEDESNDSKYCRKNNKIKLGIASGLFNINTPVEQDFQGVISRLDRSKFSITFIITNEKGSPLSPVLSKFKDVDNMLLIQKAPNDNTGDWVTRVHQEMLDLQLDVLLYLDTTMSSHMHRLAMTRYAPITAASHGHPMTSGFPQHVMDYYISWGAAELDNGQQYYTEELLLLAKDNIHQYYEHDNMDMKNHVSLHDGMSYASLLQKERSEVFNVPDDDSNWYLCMQKPFKLQPEFDAIICGILEADPHARLILHEPSNEYSTNILLNRFQQIQDCDIKRIHFIPVQPHSKLLALYSMSDIVLDSFPMSGCTTTREVLQLSKIVMTLPSTLLGSRWSKGYYTIMDDSVLSNHVIANNENDYVQKAVALGTNIELRKDMERRIGSSIYKLFSNMNAVRGWENLLMSIAMKPCDGVDDSNDVFAPIEL